MKQQEFHGKGFENLRVISASRRIDLAGAYPERFIRLLRDKAPPDFTHTLVIWTKNPFNLLYDTQLSEEILKYSSIFIHLTVTGLGGSAFEPSVPKPGVVLSMLGRMAELAGGADHIRLRFDPIVHIKLPNGKTVCNLENFSNIANACSATEIRNVSISWMQIYPKVIKNLARKGMAPVEYPVEAYLEELAHLKKKADENGITLHGCCVPFMPVSKCIDGNLLQRIHPGNLLCSNTKAKGQRTLCGCTECYDIGWYGPCCHGCIYCYANPKIV